MRCKVAQLEKFVTTIYLNFVSINIVYSLTVVET